MDFYEKEGHSKENYLPTGKITPTFYKMFSKLLCHQAAFMIYFTGMVYYVTADLHQTKSLVRISHGMINLNTLMLVYIYVNGQRKE